MLVEDDIGPGLEVWVVNEEEEVLPPVLLGTGGCGSLERWLGRGIGGRLKLSKRIRSWYRVAIED